VDLNLITVKSSPEKHEQFNSQPNWELHDAVPRSAGSTNASRDLYNIYKRVSQVAISNTKLTYKKVKGASHQVNANNTIPLFTNCISILWPSPAHAFGLSESMVLCPVTALFKSTAKFTLNT
jgi:hypothetical protein